MRYIIEENPQDPEHVVEVVGPKGEESLLPMEHPGAVPYIDDLRDVIAAIRQVGSQEDWFEHPDGVRVDIVDQRPLRAKYEHVNLLVLAARAIELELYSPEIE
jgi:hypothetical protein